MRLANAADIHLGRRQYGLKQREIDAVLSFQHFLSQARERDTDAILIPGDLFDSRDIRPQTLQKAEELLEDVQLKQSILDETYNRRTGVEQTNDAVKDCGLGHVRARGRVHARTEVFVALCLRFVVAITNYERGNAPGGEML